MSKKKFTIDKDSLYQKIMPASVQESGEAAPQPVPAAPTSSSLPPSVALTEEKSMTNFHPEDSITDTSASIVTETVAPPKDTSTMKESIVTDTPASEKQRSEEDSTVNSQNRSPLDSEKEQPLSAHSTDDVIEEDNLRQTETAKEKSEADDTSAGEITPVETVDNAAALTTEDDKNEQISSDEITAADITDEKTSQQLEESLLATDNTAENEDSSSEEIILTAATNELDQTQETVVNETISSTKQPLDVASEKISQPKAFPRPINLAEKIILARVREALEADGICTCQQCQLDTAALALNHLPTKYVSSFSSSVALGDIYYHQHFAQILRAMMLATEKVKETPRHNNYLSGEPILVNVMECLVEEWILKMVEEEGNDSGFCHCDNCLSDIAACMLNGLLPRYLTTTKGLLASHLIFMRHQYAIDLTTQYLKASELVRENPRH